ncbi:gasdermin-E [Alosa pseudoharengus]|uniref:gasdermin-E n=1 Tax=Alosa pseudoharengus TaxID=34774 RepID=UPI003F8BBB4A
MFAKVTRHLVSETDPDGSLLAVTRLTDSDKLQPLGVVLKSQKKWPWQRPKYRPTDFTLTQITQGRKTLRPVLVKSDFLDYESTYAGTMGGSLSAEVGGVRVKAEGQGSSQLHSSLGKLHKEVVNINKLMNDSKDRLVDLQHPLVQQSLCKRKVITVLKERIFTSNSCSVRYHGLGAGSCGALLAILKTVPLKCGGLKVSVNEDSTLQMDSEVSMEIPSHTVLAYSVTELRIKRSGQYELCLQADVEGGFDWNVGKTEDDSSLCEVDGPLEETEEFLSIQNTFAELANLKEDLGMLSDLDAVTRSSLFSLLGPSILDKDFLSVLEDWLDARCSGEVADISECQDQRVQAIFYLLWPIANQDTAHHGLLSSRNGKHATLPNEETGSSSPSANQSSAATGKQVDGLLVGHALHLLVSALLELTIDCLDLIKSCCSAGLLPSVSQLTEDLMKSQPFPLDAVPPLLQCEEAFRRVESLFLSAHLQLVRQTDKLLVESKEATGFQPLTLCIALQGLASLMSE